MKNGKLKPEVEYYISFLGDLPDGVEVFVYSYGEVCETRIYFRFFEDWGQRKVFFKHFDPSKLENFCSIAFFCLHGKVRNTHPKTTVTRLELDS